MTIIKGIEWGVSHNIIRMKEGYQMSPPGSASQYNFDDLSCFAPNNTRLGVLSIVVRLRGTMFSFNTVANSVMDAVSLSQLISNVSIKLADNSPPSRFDGGDMIINSMDNYRALQCLSWLSGKPAIWAKTAGNERFDVPTQLATTTDPANTAVPFGGTTTRGWLQNCRGYFNTNATPQVFNYDVLFFYNVGIQRGEAHGSCAIPANWFTGEREGCARSGNGYIQLVLGSLVDNQAVTWASSITADFYALVCNYNLGDQPVPTTPKIRTLDTNASVFKVPSKGITKGLFFMPRLTSAGAMQTTDYERVEIYSGGGLAVESQVDLNRISQTFFGGSTDDQRYFDIPTTYDALLNTPATRTARAMEPLLAYPDSNIHAPLAIDELAEVKIVTAVTTDHKLVQVALNPITPEVRAAANEWSYGSTTLSSSTSNGNQPKEWTGKAMAIPAVAEVDGAVLTKTG